MGHRVTFLEACFCVRAKKHFKIEGFLGGLQQYPGRVEKIFLFVYLLKECGSQEAWLGDSLSAQERWVRSGRFGALKQQGDW